MCGDADPFRPVDEDGVPTEGRDESSAPYCPAKPCRFCTGDSALRDKNGQALMSFEACQMLNTCAATCDWERIYGRE